MFLPKHIHCRSWRKPGRSQGHRSLHFPTTSMLLPSVHMPAHHSESFPSSLGDSRFSLRAGFRLGRMDDHRSPRAFAKRALQQNHSHHVVWCMQAFTSFFLPYLSFIIQNLIFSCPEVLGAGEFWFPALNWFPSCREDFSSASQQHGATSQLRALRPPGKSGSHAWLLFAVKYHPSLSAEK